MIERFFPGKPRRSTTYAVRAKEVNMGFEDMEVVRKGYLPQRGIGVTAVQVAMEQWEQTMKERNMNRHYYAAMSRDTGMTAFENNFRQVCKVKFIKSAQFDGDIEQRLAVLLNSGMEPSLTDKEYYYRHDIVGLNRGDIVLVPARDTITLAIVSRVGLESSHFAGQCPTARSTMRKVLALLSWSPAMNNLALERRDTEIKKAQLAELKQQYKKAQAEYHDLNVRLSNACNKVAVLNNEIRAFEREGGF